jgi:hypothetical protein
VSSGGPPSASAQGLSLRLPSLTLSAGAAVVLDAGATGIPPADRNAFNYDWALSQKASGNRVDSAKAAVARFNLTTADAYQLQLTATDQRTKAVSSATSNVRVLARSGAPLPRVTADSKCGPFRLSAAAEARLSCPDLAVVSAEGSAPYTNLTYAWRVTNVKTAQVKTGIGKEFNAGRCVFTFCVRFCF